MAAKTIDEEAIFKVACRISAMDARSAYLEQVCGEDGALLARLNAMLDLYFQDPSFLEHPVSNAVAALNLPAVSEPIGSEIGPYKLREQIAEGGMGVVYIAEQTQPVHRKVALKVIKPGMDTKQVIARFEAERQTLALMDHPHIAQVYDGGTTESGRPFFVMELVHGVPITEFCDHYQLSVEQRLQLFIDVCQAIQHAHQKGIIHRDVKPSNVLVALHDDKPLVKVIDFGVAKAINQELIQHTIHTRFAQMVGTPAYMSPEQAELRPLGVDTRTDVYSLGVMLYELLTGATPIDKEHIGSASYDELLRIIREKEPVRPSARISTLQAEFATTVAERRHTAPLKLSQQLRGELDAIVIKCLEKDRGRRYEAASALAEDVERFLKNEPIMARSPSAAYRIRKFVRRNRVLVASLVAVFVALSLGAAAATLAFLHAGEQRDLAENRLAEITKEQENNEILIKALGDSYGFPWGRHMYGEEQTMHESLEAFSTQLDMRFMDRPKLEMRFRLVLAHAHYKRGEDAIAREHLQKALDLAEREYGRVHEHVADILTDFAHDVQRYRENNSLAEDLLIKPFDAAKRQADAQRAVDIYTELDIQTLGRGHALFCLAWYVEPNVARHKEAESYLREALKISRSLRPGEDSHRQLYAMWDVVEHLTWQKAGSMEEAQSLIQEAVAMSKRFMGEQDSVTAGLLGERGELYRFLGDEQEALRSYHEAYKILTGIAPPNDVLPHSYGLTLAEVYFVAHRHQEGLQILNEVERDCRDREMDSYVRCHYLRGWAHLLREDYAAAELSLQQAVKLADEHLDENHAYAHLSRFHLARTLESLGRQAEAQKQYQRLLPLTQQRVRLPDARQMELFAHAWVLLHSDSMDELTLRDALDSAEQGLKRAAVWPQYGSGPHLYLVKALGQYKLAHMRQQDIGQAIATLREGLQQHEFIPLRPRHKHVPMSRHELELQLAEWLDEQGNKSKAEQVLSDAVELRMEHLAGNHPEVALAKLRLGSFLVRLGEFDRAEGVLRNVYEKLSMIPQAADANLERAAALMVDLLRQEGRHEEMAEWQAKAEAHR